MTHKTIETDYLIIGCGAVGMAFADVILNETDASITLIDQHHKPGGHWNDAYSFVTLHQPSAYYGVSSKELSQGHKDQVGWNQGLHELATGDEVLAYFDQVMRQQFLPSGRVQYFPLCQYTGDGQFHSLVSGQQQQIQVKQKVVDATYFKTAIPSTHTPNYTWDKGVTVRPINDLPALAAQGDFDHFTVVGAGKTGIDACLWLLQHQVSPDAITWIMPRDAWLLDRKNTQHTPEFFTDSVGAQAKQMQAVAESTSIDDMFDRLESAGVLLRIDPTVKPRMFHGATISAMEMQQLRKIKQVVRLGRLKHINQQQLQLQQGQHAAVEKSVYIDCSARAVNELDTVPVFNGDLITIQTVRTIQPVFSAAFIAHIEASKSDETSKNKLCSVVKLPNHDTDWIRANAAFMMNQYHWGKDPEISQWLLKNRLDGFSQLMQSVQADEQEKIDIINTIRQYAGPAVMKMQAYIEALDAA